MTELWRSPIGFFDSGLGGLTVLKRALQEMPNENYIYFGDSKNAPYGSKSKEEILSLSIKNIEYLINKGSKAIVIACNTTSLNFEDYLKEKFKTIPIIAIRPPIEEVVKIFPKEKVVIMATVGSINSECITNMVDVLNVNSNIVKMPCPGLVEIIESGNYDSDEAKNFLLEKFKDHKDSKAIILGCTHYPFVQNTLKSILGNSISFFDGCENTIVNLRNELAKKNLFNEDATKGYVKIYNSLESEYILNLSEKLLYSNN